MGFYIDMQQAGPDERLFEEKGVPSVFWVLYGVAFFAVVCMGLAAFTVLRDLFAQGTTWDKALLVLIVLFIPAIALIGLKLAFFRKFVEFTDQELTIGYRIRKNGPKILKKKFSKESISEIYLVNKKQTPNLALSEHKDLRYQIRGHWKVIAESNSKKKVLDRHTDRSSLVPLYGELKRWLGH